MLNSHIVGVRLRASNVAIALVGLAIVLASGGCSNASSTGSGAGGAGVPPQSAVPVVSAAAIPLTSPESSPSSPQATDSPAASPVASSPAPSPQEAVAGESAVLTFSHSERDKDGSLGYDMQNKPLKAGGLIVKLIYLEIMQDRSTVHLVFEVDNPTLTPLTFRPTDAEIDADGALYHADYFNAKVNGGVLSGHVAPSAATTFLMPFVLAADSPQQPVAPEQMKTVKLNLSKVNEAATGKELGAFTPVFNLQP